MPYGAVPASFCIQYPMDTMLALVSGSPRAVRMASDHAFWFCPVGVWYSAVGCGVSVEPDVGGREDGAVVGACVGVLGACAGVLARVMLGVASAVAECRCVGVGDDLGVRAARLAGT